VIDAVGAFLAALRLVRVALARRDRKAAIPHDDGDGQQYS